MQMLYNSDSYSVVQFDLTGDEDALPAQRRGGYEIVDKLARKEIFIEGVIAQAFRRGVEAIVERGPASEEAIDEYIAGFAVLAQQPLVLH
jgi:hypothetical protein